MVCGGHLMRVPEKKSVTNIELRLSIDKLQLHRRRTKLRKASKQEREKSILLTLRVFLSTELKNIKKSEETYTAKIKTSIILSRSMWVEYENFSHSLTFNFFFFCLTSSYFTLPASEPTTIHTLIQNQFQREREWVSESFHAHIFYFHKNCVFYLSTKKRYSRNS